MIFLLRFKATAKSQSLSHFGEVKALLCKKKVNGDCTWTVFFYLSIHWQKNYPSMFQLPLPLRGPQGGTKVEKMHHCALQVTSVHCFNSNITVSHLAACYIFSKKYYFTSPSLYNSARMSFVNFFLSFNKIFFLFLILYY